ncbi:VCBS repeat-containing protein [Candidatus Fermentibacteria bacterium]|nr:VCBS repeat-containing protein [Candidatus Fermentibacteria bacterium]
MRLIALFLAASFAICADATTRYVPADFTTIQAAINASTHGDTVLVAPGVYRENINFRGRNLVLASHFIVDGNPDHIMQTIIDGSNPAHPDTASCVLIVSGEDSTAVLEGFTLTGGTGTVWRDTHLSQDYREGGGILVELASPVIRHNLIVDNEATDDTGLVSAGGGGIRCGDANPLITGNVIAGNRGRYGAGIVMNFCTGSIVGNVICDNEGGEDYGGSGIWLYEVGPTMVEGNTITGNISALEGGGIRVWATAITGSHNILWGNTSGASGHQISLSGGSADLTYCDVQGGWEGMGNVDAHPLFDTMNLYLTYSSPCVDTGDPASIPDPEDPSSPGMARYPAMGGLRRDMGAYGGRLWPLLASFSRPRISLPASEFRFSFVEPGSRDTLSIPVQSTGSGAVVIERAEISDDVGEVITVISSIPATIPAFDSQTVLSVWAPTQAGPMFGTLSLYHNDPATPNPLEIALRIEQFAEGASGILADDQGDSRSVNWIDFDTDGLLDLFITNGPQGGQNNRLYRNEGGGAFSSVSGDPIVNDGSSSVGSSWADFDNDGDLDALVVNWYGQNNLLYSNNGDGSFSRISAGPVATDGGHSETCGWADYDNDALLDVFVANSGPDEAECNFLYRGSGGAFTTITEGAIVTDLFHSRSVSWADYDGDGDLDLFVANEANEYNSLYRNDGDGSFTMIPDGPVVTTRGRSFGSSWGDFDNDGDLDLFVANWGDQNNFLFKNNGDGTFARVMSGSVVNDRGYSIGSAWGDFDNDGDLDLFVANGFSQDPGEDLADFLYLNNGDGSFARVMTGPVAAHRGWGYGAAWGDFDRDGHLDLAVARCFGRTETTSLFRNTGTKNNWLTVQCRGTRANSSAIGATVRVKANIGGQSVWQFREISSQTGACGQNQMAVHFGLGEAGTVDSLVICWPRGGMEVFTNLPVNRHLEVAESAVSGQCQPRPDAVRLGQNRPNPFHSRTTILVSVHGPCLLSLGVFDLQGRRVRQLRGEEFAQSESIVHEWDGADESGRFLPSGIYVCRAEADGVTATRRMTLLR